MERTLSSRVFYLARFQRPQRRGRLLNPFHMQFAHRQQKKPATTPRNNFSVSPVNSGTQPTDGLRAFILLSSPFGLPQSKMSQPYGSSSGPAVLHLTIHMAGSFESRKKIKRNHAKRTSSPAGISAGCLLPLQ